MTGGTPLVRCKNCDVPIAIRPLEVAKGSGIRITLNWGPVFEHMKKFHPELWTPGLAQEYEDWKAGKIG